MNHPWLYLFSVAVMSFIAAVPLSAATDPLHLLFVAAGVFIGIFLISINAAEIVHDFPRTCLTLFLGLSLVSLAYPVVSFIVLMCSLFFIRLETFFGSILFACFLVIGHGMNAAPSILFAALFLLLFVAASHIRVVSRFSGSSVWIIALVFSLALVIGFLTAFLPEVELSFAPVFPGGKPPLFVPLVFIVLLSLFLAYVVSRYLHAGKAVSKKEVVSDEEAEVQTGDMQTAKQGRRFAGPRTNREIIRRYLQWRERLKERGILFRKDRTAEESEAYIARCLAPAHDEQAGETLSAITRLFNAARYNNEEIGPEHAGRFKELIEAVLRTAKKK